jgi:hypothetical protein
MNADILTLNAQVGWDNEDFLNDLFSVRIGEYTVKYSSTAFNALTEDEVRLIVLADYVKWLKEQKRY